MIFTHFGGKNQDDFRYTIFLYGTLLPNITLNRFSSGLHCNWKLLNPNPIKLRFGLAFCRGPPGQTQMEYLQLFIIWGKDSRQNHLRMLSAQT